MPKAKEDNDCFVIMPISDPDGYETGHFQHVYDDLISPACDNAGYNAIRADDVLQTNLIHLDVLKRLLETPMAICDLSTRNPNVLFELGLRQAFDKPVVLVQEKDTPQIFDIAPLRDTEYRKERVYHEVLEDQKAIAEALKATADAANAPDGLNSIVNLLSLTAPAALKEFRREESSPMMQVVMAEIGALRNEFRVALRERVANEAVARDGILELESVRHSLREAERLILSGDSDPDRLRHGLHLCNECMELAEHVFHRTRNRGQKWRTEAEMLQHQISALREHAKELLDRLERKQES